MAKEINLDGLAACEQMHPELPVDRKCEEPLGHSGPHVVNDGEGRPEYYWDRPERGVE